MLASTESDDGPKVSPRLLWGFQWYARRYLRKSFHTVSIAEPLPEPPPLEAPLIVYLNHAAWWDPLVAVHLAQVLTPERTLYAPFDSEALKRYPVFEKLGFFGVEQGSRRGAAQFLKTGRRVLQKSGASLWMTPEGRFVDPREREAAFEPGLAHLAHRLAADARGAVLWPLAIEYPFWEERLPEALCSCGEPIAADEHKSLDKSAWDALLVDRLRQAQQTLAAKSIARETDGWRVLLGGAEGVGGLYERVRWMHAKLTGQPYRAAHGEKLTGA